MVSYSPERARDLLRIGCGKPDADFREGQEEAIRHVVEGRGRILVVQKTGWGKSFVYFIATKLLRESGHGLCLLISPLLSLMRNQIQAAERMGVRAATINSGNTEEWDGIEASIERNEVDILLISPERLDNEHFKEQVLLKIAGKISLVVVDEAHCISDWGHDFRPQYRLIERIIRRLPQNLRLLATTATANNRVMADLQEVLGPNLTVSHGDLNRPSLVLQTMRLPSQAERLAWLAEKIPLLPGHGIIYTLTVRDAVRVANWLQIRGLDVRAYTSETEDREVLEQTLLRNGLKALVSTTALGMGFDKPDLSFVIHYQTPGSVVAYYQQVGRAGRAIDLAYGILLSGDEESEIVEYFIESAFPTRAEVDLVIQALNAEPDGLTSSQLLRKLNISKGRIDKALLLLSLESPAPIVKDGSKWQLTAAEISKSFWERAERLTALRRVEQAQMQQYVGLTSGHMGFLVSALDGDPRGIEPPTAPQMPSTIDPILVQEAIKYLRRSGQNIEPRKIWPSGGTPSYGLRGNIAENLRIKAGKALCVWGDEGWGTLVRQGKYHDRHYSDDLVEACVRLFREWNPQPAPTWVTCVPSLRHPDLVPDFGRRVAAALGLPFIPTLAKTDNRPEQKTMANSIQQALNIDGSIELSAATLPAGPVLLIDDMVDSKWTITVAGWILRKNGSGEVWPMALALTGHAQ